MGRVSTKGIGPSEEEKQACRLRAKQRHEREAAIKKQLREREKKIKPTPLYAQLQDEISIAERGLSTWIFKKNEASRRIDELRERIREAKEQIARYSQMQEGNV